MSVLPHIITHINRYARLFVDEEESILLLLDGHKSRNGSKWVELAREKY